MDVSSSRYVDERDCINKTTWAVLYITISHRIIPCWDRIVTHVPSDIKLGGDGRDDAAGALKSHNLLLT